MISKSRNSGVIRSESHLPMLGNNYDTEIGKVNRTLKARNTIDKAASKMRKLGADKEGHSTRLIENDLQGINSTPASVKNMMTESIKQRVYNMVKG